MDLRWEVGNSPRSQLKLDQSLLLSPTFTALTGLIMPPVKPAAFSRLQLAAALLGESPDLFRAPRLNKSRRHTSRI